MKYCSILIALMIVSCVSTKTAMGSWVGHTKKEVVMSWGPPSYTCSDGGNGEILVYSQQMYIPGSNSPMTMYQHKMFYVDVDNKVYHWKITKSATPPDQIVVTFN